MQNPVHYPFFCRFRYWNSEVKQNRLCMFPRLWLKKT